MLTSFIPSGGNHNPHKCVCPKSQFQNTWGKILTELKEERDEFTLIVGDFIASLSVINRTTRQENQ